MTNNKSRKVLLYGDVDLRYTDGSAVWLVSIAKVLAQTNSNVSILLKSSQGAGGLFDDLAAIDGIEIIDDFTTKVVRGPRYQTKNAASRIEDLVRQRNFDAVICRGFELCKYVARQPIASKRLWAYMTDIPQAAEEFTPAIRSQLQFIAARARRVFAQTDEARDFLEHHIPEACGKTLLLPPMLPSGVNSITQSEVDAPLRLVYAGKFASRWNTLEMCSIPTIAKRVGRLVEVTMIGDKFQNDPNDPDWTSRMRVALEASPGVTWIGALSREESLQRISQHDVGLAWRDSTLDTSHEISTKLLEYIAMGVPPLVNRTVMHEALLGSDYPLFVDGGNLDAALRALPSRPNDWDALRESLSGAVSTFTFSARASYLENELQRADSEGVPSHSSTPVEYVGSREFGRGLKRLFASMPSANVVPYDANTVTSKASAAARNIFVDATATDPRHLPSDPYWIVAQPLQELEPLPPGVSPIGVLSMGDHDLTTVARWAGVSVGSVIQARAQVDPTANRKKLQGAEFAIAVVLAPGDLTWATTSIRKMIACLQAFNPRYHVKLMLADSEVESNWLTNERLIDAIFELSSDSSIDGAWSFERPRTSASLFREISWIAGSRPGAIEQVFGYQVSRAGVRVLPPLCGSLQTDDPQERGATLANTIARAEPSEFPTPESDEVDDLAAKSQAQLLTLVEL